MSVNPKQMRFFDEHAECWDTISVHDPDIVEHISSLLDMKGNESILDVGTGTGIMIPYYEKHLTNGRILAIDYSEKMINVAKRKYPETSHPMIRYEITDLYDFHTDEKFDRIVCYSCFPHFPDQAGAIKHLAGFLKPGGMLMISHGCSRDKINRVHNEGGEIICNDYLPNLDVLTDMFSKACLKVIFTQDDENTYLIAGQPKKRMP